MRGRARRIRNSSSWKSVDLSRRERSGRVMAMAIPRTLLSTGTPFGGREIDFGMSKLRHGY